MLSKNLKSLWNRVSLLGCDSETTFGELLKIRLINRMAMVLLITVSFFLSFRIILELPLDGVDAGLLLITLFILTLNYFKLVVLARHLTCWLFPFVFAIMLFISHRDFGYYSVFLLCAILAFIQYEGQRKLQVTSIIFISTLGILCIWHISSLNHFNKIPINQYEQFISFIGTIIAAFLIVYFYQTNIKESQTEKEKLILSLRNKNEELVRVNEALDQFAYIASHDLKTPLLNITNFSGLLETNFRAGIFEDAELQLSYIRTNAERMNNLINDLFEFTRIDDDTNIKKELINLNELFKTVVNDLDPTITSKNAKVSAELLPSYYCDEHLMASIFRNLIQNGIKYNESASPEVIITSTQSNKKIKLFFKDNGIGINEKYHERIFEFFKRLHNHQVYKGTGMGLGLTKKIVQKMSGNIRVESEERKGSTFIIELPV